MIRDIKCKNIVNVTKKRSFFPLTVSLCIGVSTYFFHIVETEGSANEHILPPPQNAINGNPSQIDQVSMTAKIPPFWNANSRLWFCQVESQFETRRIVSEKTRYHYVVASIESEILAQVSDVITNPPAENPYTALKNSLLERFADSAEKRIKKLLREMSLGDKRPSYLLREMKDLAGAKLSDEWLKSLWIQHLPQQTQAILYVSNDDLSKQAILADKICEITDPATSAVNSVSDKNRFSQLEKQIAALTTKIDQLNKPFRRDNARSRSHSRVRSKSASHDNSSLVCWYHRKFKADAKKCTKPCNFPQTKN